MTVSARRSLLDVAMLLLALLFLVAATSCASAPPAPPARQLPPTEAWPYCALQCAESGQLFIGVVVVDPEGRQFGCGCGPKPSTPQTWWGPT